MSASCRPEHQSTSSARGSLLPEQGGASVVLQAYLALPGHLALFPAADAVADCALVYHPRVCCHCIFAARYAP